MIVMMVIVVVMVMVMVVMMIVMIMIMLWLWKGRLVKKTRNGITQTEKLSDTRRLEDE